LSREEPSIAAIIPARDAGDALATAIGSVLRQDGEPMEVLVVDDDGARAVVERLAEPRVRLIEGAKRGAGAARNAGLRATDADWVAFLDADDVWLEGYLERLREAIRSNPEAGACFSGAVHLSENGRVLNLGTVRADDATLVGLLTRRIQPTVSATAVNRRLVLELGGFDEDFLCPAGVQDIDLWWRIAAVRTCIVQPVPLVHYIVHERRDRLRSRSELGRLARDRRRCIERLEGRVPPELFRRAAAQHLAIMARYWLVAGYAKEGRREALASLRYAPTANGFAALAFALLPSRARGVVRSIRRTAIRNLRQG
jgi:glycosyltransferase involved in cell wall biosynthesis